MSSLEHPPSSSSSPLSEVAFTFKSPGCPCRAAGGQPEIENGGLNKQLYSEYIIRCGCGEKEQRLKESQRTRETQRLNKRGYRWRRRREGCLRSAELFWMTEEHCLPWSLYLERNVRGEPTTRPGNPGTVCAKHTCEDQYRAVYQAQHAPQTDAMRLKSTINQSFYCHHACSCSFLCSSSHCTASGTDLALVSAAFGRS